MRASRRQASPGASRDVHVSGAEGLYAGHEVPLKVREYVVRAQNHPRGAPDRIFIAAERLDRNPIEVLLLGLSTIQCASPEEARGKIRLLLSEAGVSRKAVDTGLRVVFRGAAMRGAAVVRAESGVRAEPDSTRGVRASRLGIETDTAAWLGRRLGRLGINTVTVREALAIASKVASCPGVVAELCVSDDPDYTTGYVASKRFGYIRIPQVKTRGSFKGGRVFFVAEHESVERSIQYLEKVPVLVVRALEGLKAL